MWCWNIQILRRDAQRRKNTKNKTRSSTGFFHVLLSVDSLCQLHLRSVFVTGWFLPGPHLHYCQRAVWCAIRWQLAILPQKSRIPKLEKPAILHSCYKKRQLYNLYNHDLETVALIFGMLSPDIAIYFAQFFSFRAKELSIWTMIGFGLKFGVRLLVKRNFGNWKS